MAILVTGATGFVMANLVRHLAEGGHAVVAADLNPPDEPLGRFFGGHSSSQQSSAERSIVARTPGSSVAAPGTVTFRRLDVTNAQAVRALVRELGPERTVHGAAITSIPADVERARFLDTVAVNVTGTVNVLDALRERGTGRVVVVSSGSVYGPRPDPAPISEDDPKAPQGVYPITKWSADMLARRFAEVHRLDLAVTRLASPFGPFERDTGSRPLLSPIGYWAAAAARGETIRAGGPPDFARDVIYAADVASGIAAVLLAERLPHDAYNVGWGHSTTTEETLAALARLVPGVKIERDLDAPFPWAASPRGPLCVDRLRHDLGWAPRHDLTSGLAAYLEWVRAEPRAF